MKHVLLAACAGLLLASGVALAQPAAGAAPGRPEVKSVGDWFVRCLTTPSPSPCEMLQEMDSPNTHQRLLSVSMAYIPSLDRHVLQITVPLDISIPKGVVIQTDQYKSPVLKYRRCDRSGCYVEQAIDNGVVEALSKSGPAGKVTIAADNGKTYALNFSLKGFAAARDDMAAQARAKAKPVEKSGDAAPAATP